MKNYFQVVRHEVDFQDYCVQQVVENDKSIVIEGFKNDEREIEENLNAKLLFLAFTRSSDC